MLYLKASLSATILWAWAYDSNLDLARVFETISDRISASILDLLRTSSLAALSASNSISILDLRRALSLAARSAAISA